MISQFILFFPIIPILLIGIIASCAAGLAWYAGLSSEEKELADREAMRAFGRKFKELSESQQDKIKNRIS